MRHRSDESESGPSTLMDRLGRLGVELVTWPEQAALRSALARAGVPRLLMVQPSGEPPNPLGVGEDWVRLPADEALLVSIAERLLRRMARFASVAPTIDADRVLRRAEVSVALSPFEAKIATRLLEHSGTVVSRDELERILWSDGLPPSERSLDYVVQRLRRRLADINIVINTVRGRGFVIYVAEPVLPPDS